MSGSTIGGVDASIPLQAGKGVQQPNPLSQIGEFAHAANALNQLKLFPGQQQLQQQAVQGGAVGLSQKINQAGYAALAPLLADPNITHDKLTTGLASIEHNLGIPTGGIIQDVMATAPNGDGPDFDAKVRALIASRAQIAPESAVGMVTRRAGPVLDNGPTLQPTTVEPPGSPNSGVVAPAGQPVGKDLSPGEAATPTQIGTVPVGQPNAGAPVRGTLRQFIGLTGDGASPFGTGRLPPALLNPNAPHPAAPAGVVTGVGPAQDASLQTRGAQSAKAFQDISEQGVQAKSQAAILDNMLGDTAQFVPGPGADKIKFFKAVLQRIGSPIGVGFGVSPESLAANESFDKLANQLANAQGAGSDARMAVNQGANPSSSRSPAGVDLLIRQLRGNADYLAARAKLAAAYPDQTDRPGFEANVAANLDPRVFQYARLLPDQKAIFLKTMKDTSAFKSAYNWADKRGLIGAANVGQ